MTTPPFDLKRAHAWFAVEFNNLAWELIEQSERTESDAERLVHTAHASCLHWLEVGTPVNHQRALCLLANVYAVVEYPESALRHARRCMELSESNTETQTDFDRATALECLARALACAGDLDSAREYRAAAQQAGEAISDAEEREYFLNSMLTSGKWFGLL